MAINPNNTPRVTFKAPSVADFFYMPQKATVQYTPEVGKKIFEVGDGWMHPGTTINNLFDVSGKSQDEIFDIVKGLDSRALQGAPQEILDLIKSGDIAHIFTTDPTESGGFMNLLPDKQKEVQKLNGSLYFRDKEGRTARWKLPEISSNDAGWNANAGNDIFSKQTAYGDNLFATNASQREDLLKKVSRGKIPVDTVHPELIQTSVVDDILKKETNLTVYDHLGVLSGTEADQARSIHYPNSKRTPTAAAPPAAAPAPQPVVAPSPTPSPAAPAPTPAAPAPATVAPINQKPVGQPVQAAAPTSAPTTTTKPVGRPVISVDTPPPPPTGAGAQKVSAQMTATVQDTVNFSKNTTPEKIAAVVEHHTQAKVLTSGAPTPRQFLKKTGDDISKSLLGGTKGTRNIKLAGAAALLGLGAYAVSKKSHQTNDDYDRKLEMQRRGMMM
jgi:hypothetical protein